MRIVFDTNVLIAAFLTHGTSAEVLDHCLTQHELYTSIYILNEFETALRSKKIHFSPHLIDVSLTFLKHEMTIVPIQRLTKPISRDRKDDAILATALAARASLIVSGDKDLLVLTPFRGIAILSPSHFWEWEQRKK